MRFATRHWAIALWLVFVACCIFVVARLQIGADLSAFLPRKPSSAQQLLTEQLRNGVVSRLILIGIEGSNPDVLAETSKQLAQRLRNDDNFVLVNNGESSSLARDQAFLLENRYMLSPAVTPQHFTAGGLHAALEKQLELLGSPVGMLVKQVIPRDPSGEMVRLVEGFSGQSQPLKHDDAWLSQDGKRAVMLVQTRAAGYDIDAQQQDIARIHTAFSAATRGAEFSGVRLLLSGPGVFSVEAREHIKGVAFNFSIITAFLIGTLLLLVYRSWRALAVSLLPVISGALAGIAVVSLGYGVVYGITLGFGITLIGEAVDYAIYFLNRLAPGKHPSAALENIWPTLRLGVLTTICGFSPMFLADFPGLAQLGLFSVTGLIVAVLVTRWVLPVLVPMQFSVASTARLGDWLMERVRRAPRLKPVAALAVLAAAASLALHRGPVWSDALSSLFPISIEKQQLDQSMRNDLGAPDVRYMVIVSGRDRETALHQAELAGAHLDALATKGILTGYDTPARYLPSLQTQQERSAAIPEPPTLRQNLRHALVGLPFRADLFEPFIKEAAAARERPPLTAADLQGTNFGLQAESLMLQRNGEWIAMLPLRGVTDATEVQRVIEAGNNASNDFALLDMKQESDALYQTYVREAIMLSGFGALAILVLLIVSLRSVRRIAMVLLPLAGAVIIATAVMAATGQKLLIFHLVGLLLSVAVGSNYSLFFDREIHSGDPGEDRRRTIVSLLIANISTIIGFGMLAFSGVPVLTAIGGTVAVGAFLSLLFSAVLMGDRVAR